MSPVTEAIDPQTRQLGAAIRAARLSQALTLVELARLAGLSHPFLSQLERGQARPSMVSLERIARALETSQLELLASASEPWGPVSVTVDARAGGSGSAALVRAHEGVRGPYAEGEARLLVGRRASFQPMEFTGSNTEYGDFYHHPEDEFVTVIAGRVVIDLAGDGEFVLDCGDSVYYDGDTPHRWRSADRGAYRLLIVKQRLQKEPV
ncbi:XRE family transcriptional regulator [Subtercola sp. Z020]|uniref:helix-turn-helix domain-containing protein n=1 Tax=Subtercola sp. Z020 TaxID=2080582 RepID=UPI000CE939B2|nr:XRE family transcriptional regulator [Subtercola sp. Z020]PPF84507.1 XRE family transcriptional regulator [Subtercola sp. Z020]